MRSFKLFCLLCAAALLAGCSRGRTVISGTVSSCPDSELVLKKLSGTVLVSVDTVKTDASGSFRYEMELAEGQPEFIYVYKGDSKLASLLVERGENPSFSADTLGSFSVEGSEGSVLMKEAEGNLSDFRADLYRLSHDPGLNRKAVSDAYLEHYKKSVRFVLVNCKSLASIPVLYEKVGGVNTFSAVNDALIFRSVCDSLKTVYPASPYVKALEAETIRRENLFDISLRLKNAGERTYPALSMPSMSGKEVSLDSLDAKAVLLYFWDDREATHKMYNIEVLKPLYGKYHPKGLEIYAVCVNPDKTSWGQTVKGQELPWVNVNDGLGTASRSLMLYNVRNVPAFFIVSDSALVPVTDRKRLAGELEKIL